MTDILLAVAALIILILAFIAAVLQWRLYRLRKARSEADALAREKRVEQRKRVNGSIQVIAHALEANQVGATEASIRISVLLDALEADIGVKEEFSAFYKLAEEASHIPILDAWKALPKEERKAYNQELLVLERQYQNVIMDAASRIRGREF